jgi:hypothetical protein
MKTPAFITIVVLLTGCYDLSGLESARGGVQLHGAEVRLHPAQGAPSPVTFDVEIDDTATGDQQLAFVALTGGGLVPPELPSWDLVRYTTPCADIAIVALYQRKAGGPADGRMSFALGPATSGALAVAAVRGIDAALPLGPTDESLGSSASAVYVSPEARPGTRWIGFGAAPVYNGSFAVPGMLEHAGNGHVALLFGEPETMENRLLVFSLPSPGNYCAVLYVSALLPPPSPSDS